MELCVSQYGIPASYLDIKNGKYSSYNILGLINGENDGGKRIYYYDEDCSKLIYASSGSVMVKNSERLAAIESILQSLEREDDTQTCIEDFILGGSSYMDNDGSGKYLQFLYSRPYDDKLFSMSDIARVYQDADLPRTDDEFRGWFYGEDTVNVSKFMAQRVKELEQLTIERMKYYTKEYRIMKAGI